ncbi:MAG: thioredoxin domain-containing protein [Pseudomonadota bacterium]
MSAIHIVRRTLLGGLFALALAACGEGDGSSDASSQQLVDKTLGIEDAPAVLIEYASITCGACAQYHRDIVPAIKEMVDEGRVRFVFREYPTPPAEVAVAGFAAARCAADDTAYFAMLDDMFENQQGIMAATRNGTVRTALQAVASRHGVDGETFEACLANQDIRSEIAASAAQGTADGVTSTPTLFLNGRKLTGAEGRSVESIQELVGAIAPKAES